MKIFSTASAAALLLGMGAFMLSGSAQAALPCGAQICSTWWTEYGQGNQQACDLFRADCSGCPPRSSVSGTPPAKGDGKPNPAVMNSNRAILATE